MKKLLLITGDLATGKSTFANILSKRYGASVFCKDSIKETLGDTIGFSNREENLKLSAATMGLMHFIFSEFAKLSKPLILEANFHTPELEKLHDTAHKNSYEVLTIALHGTASILHERYMKRINSEGRHPVHLSTTLDIFEHFKGYLEYSRSETIPGTVIRINADSFCYQTDEKILNTIDRFMEV